MNEPTRKKIRRWRKYLAEERAEAAVYRDLAGRRTGEERAVLLALSVAEARHEKHWLQLLGKHAGRPRKPSLNSYFLSFLAKRFGSVFVLALAQRAEGRSPYSVDADATDEMAADEQIHSEVVRALAAQGRNRLSGSFRAAVFGANDGLVSNIALVIGMAATGINTQVVLLTGIAGLLAGALSMAAGEYISVKSQKELLEASLPNRETANVIKHLDSTDNELSLVFQVRRNMSVRRAKEATQEIFACLPETAEIGMLENSLGTGPSTSTETSEPDPVGSAWAAAVSSFCFFASGAAIPILPYLFGLNGTTALLSAVVLVGIALLVTGTIVGILSGKPPLLRSLRQLIIGYSAAAITYVLGLLLGINIA